MRLRANLLRHSIGMLVYVCAAGAQGNATIEGVVRDSSRQPVAAATVYLKAASTGETRTAHTDEKGSYRFTGLSADSYSLRVESGVSVLASIKPITVPSGETVTAEFVLKDPFYDEPNFIVAGVTDPTARGGHGSDTVLRSSESLAKSTASLAAVPPGSAAEQPSAAAGHHKLAVEAEKLGNPLAAVREYQAAAELEHSETYLFDWGTELLVHGAGEPAAEVFAKSHSLFPDSLRMLLGLAAAWYAAGAYDKAASQFFAACDLNPSDPLPYLFLAKARSTEIVQLPGYLERLRRFAQLHPDNASANYYYAAALWNQRTPEDAATPNHVKELLETALRLDPKLSVAYLQLGILYASQSDYQQAIAAFRKALETNPAEVEAYYRLGQAYERTGQKEKSVQELETYERMSGKLQQDIERDRREIPQFVYKLRDGGASAAPARE